MGCFCVTINHEWCWCIMIMHGESLSYYMILFQRYCIALLILYTMFLYQNGRKEKKIMTHLNVFIYDNINQSLFLIKSLKLIKLCNVGIHSWDDGMKN